MSPGLMDTQMQKQIQRKSTKQFPKVNQFIEYRDQGLLQDTGLVAKAIINHLESPLRGEAIHLKYQDGLLVEGN